MKSHGTSLIAKMKGDLNEVERVLSLIRKGEGLTIEFKESGRALSKSVYQTVCAFLNRNGGNILLGVADDGRITGIDQGNISRIKREFASTLNNREKISPPPYLALNEIELGGVSILQVFVPESSQVHRCAGRIFDRNEDGDIDSREIPGLWRSFTYENKTPTRRTVSTPMPNSQISAKTL